MAAEKLVIIVMVVVMHCLLAAFACKSTPLTATYLLTAPVCLFVCLFDLILYVPSTIFQLNKDGSSWV